MDLVDPAAAGLVEHREVYDVVGEVVGWVRDLEAAWQVEEARPPVVVSEEAAILAASYELPGPPAVVWEWPTSPIRRPQWQVGVTAIDEDSPAGRRGVGTTNHCVHGREAIVEEIVAWRPPGLLTLRFQVPVPGIPRFTISDILEPTPDGQSSMVTVRVLRPKRADDRAKFEAMRPMLTASYEAGTARLREALEAHLAARAASGDQAGPEPALPVSQGRHMAAAAG